MFGRLWRFLRHVYWSVCDIVLGLMGRLEPVVAVQLDIGGALPEAPSGWGLPLPGWGAGQETDFLSLVALLRAAREDPSLKLVLIRCQPLDIGWARAHELHRSILALRRAGKQVWVHLEQGGLHEYLVACAADRLTIVPPGSLDITGIASEVTFFAAALEKLGVRAEVVQLGRYKSAGEAFTRQHMSAEHREMLDSLLGSLYEQVVATIAAARRLTADVVRERIDQGPFVAADALRLGLVDELAYWDEVLDRFQRLCPGQPLVEDDEYARRHLRRRQRSGPQADGSIAMLSMTGTIRSGSSSSGIGLMQATGSDSVADDLAEIRERDDIRAVVLRVSSPGGSGLASDLIWRELRITRQKKPVVISFGDVAASGGYYVGVAGSPIVAEATTITGSIGVLAGKAMLQGLYERLGINKETVARGRHSSLNSDYLPLGDEERAILRRHAEGFYDDFVRKVASGRLLPAASVEASAQGRVWSGQQAFERGLVDQLGGLEHAIEEAKLLAGAQRDTPMPVIVFPRPPRGWVRLLRRASFGDLAVAPLADMVRTTRLWAMLPFWIRFR